MQHFDCCIRTEMNMLTQVNLRKASFSKQAHELIVPQPLSHAIGYLLIFVYLIPHWTFTDLKCWLNRKQGFRWRNRHRLLLFDGRQAYDHRSSFSQRRQRITTVRTEGRTRWYRVMTIRTKLVRTLRYLQCRSSIHDWHSRLYWRW